MFVFFLSHKPSLSLSNLYFIKNKHYFQGSFWFQHSKTANILIEY